VRNGRWDAVAWNRGATRLIADFDRRPEPDHNLIWLLFTDPWFRRVLPDWENDTRRCIARFRANFARAGGNPAYQALVDELMAASPEFRPLWRQHDVIAPGDGLKRFDHPIVGMLELEHTVLGLSDINDLTMIVYSAAPGTPSAERLARLLARDTAEENAA
jgi:hypothetical protein